MIVLILLLIVLNSLIQTKSNEDEYDTHHGELLSPIYPGLSDHAWNLFGMLWGVVECQFMGETNYYRRCDFFKLELKILYHFC